MSILTLAFMAGFLVVAATSDALAAQYFVKKKTGEEPAQDDTVGSIRTEDDSDRKKNEGVKPAPTIRDDQEETKQFDQTQKDQEEDLQIQQTASAECSAKDKVKALDLYKKFKSLEQKENADTKSANEIEQYMSDPDKFEYMSNLFSACAAYLPDELTGE